MLGSSLIDQSLCTSLHYLLRKFSDYKDKFKPTQTIVKFDMIQITEFLLYGPTIFLFLCLSFFPFQNKSLYVCLPPIKNIKSSIYQIHFPEITIILKLQIVLFIYNNMYVYAYAMNIYNAFSASGFLRIQKWVLLYTLLSNLLSLYIYINLANIHTHSLFWNARFNVVYVSCCYFFILFMERGVKIIKCFQQGSKEKYS